MQSRTDRSAAAGDVRNAAGLLGGLVSLPFYYGLRLRTEAEIVFVFDPTPFPLSLFICILHSYNCTTTVLLLLRRFYLQFAYNTIIYKEEV